jgi:hypothetical protein
MNNDTDTNKNDTKPSANPAKRTWQSMEIEEVNCSETQHSVFGASDGATFS